MTIGNRYSLHFRNTAGSTWNETSPASYVLPGDTLPAKNADGTYPVTRNGLIFGWSATPSSSANITTSPANARTSGRHFTNTLGTKFYIDLPDGPGSYKLWASLGGLNTAVATALDIYLADGQGGAFGTKLTGLAFSTSHTPASGSNVDASGTVDTITNWVANDVSVAITIPPGVRGIWLSRTTGTGAYINSVDVQSQELALVDCNLSKEDSTGTATSVYSCEPAGKKIGRITSASGEQVFSVVAGGTYYTVQTIRGEQWLVTTSNRVPASFNGVITIRQTSAIWGTRDTTFTLSVIPVVGRPTDGTLEGQLTSETWLQRKAIKDLVAANRSATRWLGTAPFVANGTTDIDVGTFTSTSTFQTWYNAFTPNGTSRYRARLQNGSYPGGTFNFAWKDFGTGSLLVEPDAGHDPAILSYWLFAGVGGLEVRNLLANPGSGAFFIYVTTVSVSGRMTRLNVHHNRLGALHIAGNNRTQALTWGTAVQVEQAFEYLLEDNDIYGLKNLTLPSAVYAGSIQRNECRELFTDFSRPSPFFQEYTITGMFPDDDTHLVIKDNVIHQSSIKDPSSSASHPDFIQEARFMGYCYWYQPHPNGGNATWLTNPQNYTINRTENKIYRVTVPGVGGALPPAAGALTTGAVTFAYYRDYTTIGKMYCLVEGNVIKVDGVEYADGSGGTAGNRYLNGRQTFINSNDNIGQDPVMVFVNNISLTPSSYGLNGGSGGTIHAEYNTLVGPNEVPPAGGKALQISDTNIFAGVKARAWRNYLGKQNSAPYPNISGGSVYDDQNVPVSWSGASQYAPSPNLKGAWSQNADGAWVCTIPDVSNDMPTVRSNVSKACHGSGLIAGAKLREVHTVSLVDSVGNFGTFDIIITPDRPPLTSYVDPMGAIYAANSDVPVANPLWTPDPAYVAGAIQYTGGANGIKCTNAAGGFIIAPKQGDTFQQEINFTLRNATLAQLILAVLWLDKDNWIGITNFGVSSLTQTTITQRQAGVSTTLSQFTNAVNAAVNQTYDLKINGMMLELRQNGTLLVPVTTGADNLSSQLDPGTGFLRNARRSAIGCRSGTSTTGIVGWTNSNVF